MLHLLKAVKNLKIPTFRLLSLAFFRDNKKYNEVTSLFKIALTDKNRLF